MLVFPVQLSRRFVRMSGGTIQSPLSRSRDEQAKFAISHFLVQPYELRVACPVWQTRLSIHTLAPEFGDP